MTRPGTRVRAIAARLCDARTMQRYVDPTIADLQAEYEEATKRGNRRESARIWIIGHVAVIQVVSLQVGLRTMDSLRELTDEDRRAVRRTVLGSITMIVVTSMIFVAPFLAELFDHSGSANLALYLIPQALPLSIPVGVLFGILWGLGRISPSRPTFGLVVMLAIGASLASFSVLAWVMPGANQAFRVAVGGPGVVKGPNELTIGELRERIQLSERQLPPGSSRRPHLALSYHGRWAMGAAPFALAVFALSVTRARKSGRMMPFMVAPIVTFCYYVLMYGARELGLDRTISPFAAAWAPNATFLIVSAAIVCASMQRRTSHASAVR